MKRLSDVPVVRKNIIVKLAKLAPEEDDAVGAPSRARKTKSRKSKTTLGRFHVDKYLSNYGVEYNVKPRGNRTLYRFSLCPFNPDHKKNDSYVQQDVDGKLIFYCSHQSCNHTWEEFKSLTSGTESLARFCDGYDPDWQPEKKKSAKSAGKKYPFLKYNPEKDRVSFKAALMADYLKNHYAPILNEGKDWGGLFYHYNSTGVWEVLPEAEITNLATSLLDEHADVRRVNNALKLLEYKSFLPEAARQPDPMWLNLKNCMYHVISGKRRKHHPDFFSRVQLPVNYDPKARCPTWIDTLVLIFADDPDKAITLQEFFGYCLYPKLIFPAALFQIGSGANGKGTVQRVLEAFLGKDNISHISLKRMEDKFGPVELKDKLLNTCGETSTQPLEVTRFKEIAAADEIQAEVKYKADVKFTPIAKHMISMNEFPGVKDKTPAFYRRVIVMEYNQKFEGEEDDRDLFGKLSIELDGIFLWALEGLKRVLEKKEIYQPQAIQEAKRRMRAASNTAVLFAEEACLIGETYQAHPPALYSAYKDWCGESGVRSPYGKQRFYEQMYLHFGVKKYRPKDSTKELFIGIGLPADDGQLF